MKTIILTGGGTGGHVYPNIALLPDLKKEYSVVYIGGEGETLEKRLCAENDVDYRALPTVKLVRSTSPSATANNLSIPFKLSRAVTQAEKLIADIRPSLVFSKGGYVALPVVIAARKADIPVLCHESDLTLGLSNKIGKFLGAKILTANPDAKFGDCVGMPLRKELFSGKNLRKTLGVPDGFPVLLIVGGSSGAKSLNDFVIDNLDALTKKYFVLHIAGKNSTPKTRKNYYAVPYADDIQDFYETADVVVSRAGATALFELSALRKKCVFVPLPKAASRGDQLLNAELAKKYGARVVAQENLSSLPREIEIALSSPPMRKISTDTNGKILDLIRDSMRRGDLCSNKKR